MKKSLSFLMALIATALAANASAPVLASPSRAFSYDMSACDVNGDGMVNISDLNAVLNALLGYDSSGNCDVNNDGVVNYIDYAWLFACIMQDDSLTATEDQCDFNGDGKVDGQDWDIIFEAWKNHAYEERFDLYHYYDEDYEEEVGVGFDYLDLGPIAMLLAELAENEAPVVLAFSESEIWLSPGESKEIHIVLKSLKESVRAMQVDLSMYDEYHYLTQNVFINGSQWITPENISSPEVTEGNSTGSANYSDGTYRFISANIYDGVFWPIASFTEPVDVYSFTIMADPSWGGQYATLETQFTQVLGSQTYNINLEPIVLTIKNNAGDWPRTSAPVVTIENTENGTVVTMIAEEGGNIYYRLNKDFGDFSEWTPYTGELLINNAGSYYIQAYAIAADKIASDIVTCSFIVQALPQTDAPVITAETTADAVIVTAIGNGEVKLYQDGFEVENPFIIPRTDQDQYFTITATAQEEGKLISNTTYYYLYVPAREGGPSGDGISIYVKADQAPYLYSWDSSGSLCGDWPGTRLYDIETINRVDYYVYHFDKDMVNVIFNNGGGSQTGDFTNITHDAYFIYNGSDLAYGLIPPQVYGNPTGEYAFYVNTDGWDQVYAEVNGHSYPMTKVGVDGAGFEVYKWEASGLNYTPTTITFNDGAGRGVQDAYGNIYSREYVKGGYYIYSFYQTYYIVRLDMVTTIVYDDSSQRPALEDCSITLNSSNDEWNGYVNIEFQISGTYFSQQARQGSVWYSIDGNEWVEFTSLLNSEQQFDETVSISFNSYNDYHSLRIIARDQSGAFSEPVYLLQAVVDASSLECENPPYVEYTGQPITFVPQVYDINHNPCYVDQDFTYSFENNVDAGTALLNIQGIYPNCIGNATIEFAINPHTISGEVHTVGEWFYYTGNPITPEVIVTDAAFGTLIEGQDYVVTYENNNQVGTGRAIVDGIGNFDGHFVLEFEIIGIPGDVNYTGTVDITDLQAMVMYIFGEYNRPFNFTAADLNNDHVVNVQDVVGEANILLNGNQLAMSSGGRRMPATGDDTQASLYWENGVLYLYSTVPVAALDIINSVDSDIKWSLGARGMVVVNAPCDEGEHSVIYSLSDGVIPAGLTAIATATDQNATVVGAMLSDTDAELILVKFNDSMTGLTGINSDGGVNCNMEGSDLIINSGAALRDVDVTIYSIDGRIVDNQHLSSLNSGRTKLDVSNISDGNRYMIIVVRSGRQILATQKLTQNK